MSGDHFSLCWNNFHNNLSSGFHSLLESEHLVDVTLAAEGRYLKAHKIVLSVCSQYFKELFSVNPCKHPIVILKDVSYAALKDLLHFMYQGEVSVSQEDLSTFMKVAETLQIKGLTEETMNNASALSQNGLKNVQLVDVKNLSNSSGSIKRSKPPKKVIPNKILKPNIESTSLGIGQSANLVTHDESMDEDIKIPLVEPEVLVNEGVRLKSEPLGDDDEGENLSEHSLEIDMSSMVDTSMGESSSIGEHSQGSQPICWQSDTKPYINDASNTPALFKFTQSRKGMPHLIVDSNLFRPSGKIGNPLVSHKYWECVQNRKTGCKARCMYHNNVMELKCRTHNHYPPTEYIQQRENAGHTYYMPLKCLSNTPINSSNKSLQMPNVTYKC